MVLLQLVFDSTDGDPLGYITSRAEIQAILISMEKISNISGNLRELAVLFLKNLVRVESEQQKCKYMNKMMSLHI